MLTRILFIFLLLFQISCDTQDKDESNLKQFDNISASIKKCIDNNNFLEGEKIYDSYLNVDAGNYEYYKLGGDIKLCVSKVREAADLYSKALKIKPTEEVYYKLALIFRDTKQPENYILCVNELIKLKPNDPTYLALYGQHFASQGIYSTAIESVSKALANSKDKTELFLVRADYKYLFGDTISAITDCDSSILLNNNYCKAYVNKVTYCLYQRQLKNVLETCNTAIEHGCDTAYFTYNRGLSKLLRNDVIGARQDILKAIKLNSPDAIEFVKTHPDERFKALFTSAMTNK